MNGNKVEITVNKERARAVFEKLIMLERRKAFPYYLPSAQVPQDLVPESISKDPFVYACFLFCSCYWMRGGVKSDVAFKSLVRIYLKEPSLFCPSIIAGIENAEEILEVLKTEQTLKYQMKEISKFWMLNFKKITRFYEGDPRNLFVFPEGSCTEEILLKRIMNSRKFSSESSEGFLGFQEKMVGMLSYFFADARLISAFNFSTPIDFHTFRMLLQHQILEVKDWYDGQELWVSAQLKSKAMEALFSFVEEFNVDPVILCNALWCFSRALCSMNPNNSVSIKERKGRKSILLHKESREWKHHERLQFHNSCGNCLVSDTCTLNVPAGNYYVRGTLLLGKIQSEEKLIPLFS